MTEKNLEQAKLNYKELLEEEKRFLKIKNEFYDFVQNDSQVQEFIALKDWNYFNNRYYELMQENSVRVYLYLMEKYNNFKEKTDNDLVELAFSNIINKKDSNNIYVYLRSYNTESDDISNTVSHEYIDLETLNKIVISDLDNQLFIENNKVIIFKCKHHEPIELFYYYRIMYLRQFLLDNNEHLFEEHKVKKL